MLSGSNTYLEEWFIISLDFVNVLYQLAHNNLC